MISLLARERARTTYLVALLALAAPATAAAKKPAPPAATGGASTAPAPAGTGGASAAPPAVRSITCRSSCTGRVAAKEGGLLRLRGRNMGFAARIVFMGRGGAADDRVAPAVRAARTRVDVRVPAGAHSGPVRVVASDGTPSPPSPQAVVVGNPADPAAEQPAPVAAPGGEDVFPIRGKHDLGQSETNNFGGGRGHQGQDLFARCGTPLVAARGGTVKFKATQARAGNYVVIATPTGEDMAYMHLQAPASVDKGDRVATGAPIGRVGNTGRASGCHLHFELWTPPGWQSGGKPVDPLPYLRGLDRRS